MMTCLEALQDLELDGDRAIIDVFVDRSMNGTIHEPTLKAVSGFEWNKGTVRVHLQTEHVGIRGQWVDSWRPSINSSEIAIILEDDIDLSKYAYRWLKAAYRTYGNIPYIGGFSLYEAAIPAMGTLPKDPIFLHAILGTHGFSPAAHHWYEFRRWYHKRVKDASFHPYVNAAYKPDGWYRGYEKRHIQDNMWAMWYIRFAHDNGLFTGYPNLAIHSKMTGEGFVRPQTYLAYHRRERGLHFNGRHALPSTGHLIEHWNDTFVNFPATLKKYFYNGKEITIVNTHWFGVTKYHISRMVNRKYF